MAPPPPSNLPLTQRLLQLAQTLQFAWFGGHVALLLCTLRYLMSFVFLNYYSRMAQFTYRTAFVSAAVTYGIVVYKGYRARLRSAKPTSPLSLIAEENVQYLAMALVWLFSRQVGIALLPFAVYSIFHVASYTRANLLPTALPSAASGGVASPTSKPKQSSLGDSIGKFVKEHYDSSMMLVAILEIALWFRLVGSALLFSRGALFLLATYTAFLRARYSQSAFVQSAFGQLTARVDTAVASQSTPPAIRQAWNAFKSTARQLVDATDFGKFHAVSASGSGPGGVPGPKKSQ